MDENDILREIRQLRAELQNNYEATDRKLDEILDALGDSKLRRIGEIPVQEEEPNDLIPKFSIPDETE